MKTTKKLIIVCLAALCLSMPTFAYRIVGLSNFERSLRYTPQAFSDVPSSEWYYGNVASVYEYELMTGRSSDVFAPQANISIAETITLAARINYIYYYGQSISFDLYEEVLWYEPYVEYALGEDIISTDYPDYNAPATRAQFATILAASVNPLEFEEINWVSDGAIPDVPVNADYADTVYMLYRAGVLAGSGETRSFNPDSTITRAEAAAIITRIIDPSLRTSFDLPGEY